MAQTCFVLASKALWLPDWLPLPISDDVGEGMGGEKLESGEADDTEPSPKPGEPQCNGDADDYNKQQQKQLLATIYDIIFHHKLCVKVTP